MGKPRIASDGKPTLLYYGQDVNRTWNGWDKSFRLPDVNMIMMISATDSNHSAKATG